MNRRLIIINILTLFSLILLFTTCQRTTDTSKSERIDRRALVNRHIPVLTVIDSLSPFSVGNGEFVFTTDITGLQTFPDQYQHGIPLSTQAQWGWHSFPNPHNYSLDQTFEYHDACGRRVPYAAQQNSPASQWLRANPHRLHLGCIGFKIEKLSGEPIQPTDLENIRQKLDLWSGIIESSFSIDNDSVLVETACDPKGDQIGVRVLSKLIQKKHLAICFNFPYGSTAWGGDGADWNNPDRHTSAIVSRDEHSVLIERTLDSTKYYVEVYWSGRANFKRLKKHYFTLSADSGSQLEFSVGFGPEKSILLSDAGSIMINSRAAWLNFWKTGGAIDLSLSTDPRAHELEKRIVLSRYLTAIQCSGSLPPQETGLTCNSWYGKFHLEMHWWHAVHFALWGNPEFLEKSLPWYESIFPLAGETAQCQGYAGVRWPKMVACDGRESPSSIGVFLIWQQPHPIYYAELLYRQNPDRAILEKYQNLVFATAEFMASVASWDSLHSRYLLGPPLIPAQEIYPPDSTLNPSFELAYWTFGLKTAQKWRERLQQPPVDKWNDIIEQLAELPQRDGLYQNIETSVQTFSDSNQCRDHPALLAAFGMLPNSTIDREAMRRTLKLVMKSWNWSSTWGWDYPLMAMTAARCGEPDLAVDALLMDVAKNRYLNNGHNYQQENLPVYLPGNGGLLTAVAMMAAGWDGAPAVEAPGFPKNGKWVVKYEGLHSLP